MTRSAKVASDELVILAATIRQTMPPMAGAHRTAMSFRKLLIAFATGTSALLMQRVYDGTRGDANDSWDIMLRPK